MTENYQATREEIKASQLQHLNELLLFLASHNPFYQEKLKGVKLPLSSLSELSNIPFTIKAELVADQQENSPFGRNHTFTEEEYIRYHQTSGTTGRPLKILDTKESWEWWADCWLAVLRSAGVTSKDRVFLAFSFGPFIGFWSAYEAAKKLGALVITGGGQTSLERLQSIVNNKATVLLSTPSYALHLAEIAKEAGISLRDTAIRKTIHAGEPGASVPAIRDQIQELWGATVYDHAGMTEMGAYGFSCTAQSGLHVNEREFIAEIINPETLEPVASGEKGELILTNLGRYGYPAIRYRTHDLVLKSEEVCECGNPIILLPGGIIGRTDDMKVIRGINIFPPSIEAIIREFKEIQEFRIVFYTIGGMDQVKVEIELTDYNAEGQELFLDILRKRLRERIGLRVDVELKESHTLPRFEMKARRTVDQRGQEQSATGTMGR